MSTKDNILKAAENEFIEKGYEDSSLRNIAKMSGVTTGAIYGYFKDKDELYETIARKELNHLLTLYNNLNDYIGDMKEMIKILDKFSSDEKVQKFLIEQSLYNYKLMYENRDLFIFLFLKSGNERNKKYLDEFIELDYQESLKIIEIKKGVSADKYTKVVLKSFIKHTIGAMLELISHIEDFEEARPYLEIYIRIYITSYIQLLK
ncbi:MAG: helix-turn-helix domain-containing protein [Tissierellia bacterium]|nr:helix-turn-helix domain-containing protein [Tissierellia bacterium]